LLLLLFSLLLLLLLLLRVGCAPSGPCCDEFSNRNPACDAAAARLPGDMGLALPRLGWGLPSEDVGLSGDPVRGGFPEPGRLLPFVDRSCMLPVADLLA
jgi:hypothetical protein